MLSAIFRFVKTLVSLALVVVLAAGGWWGYRVYYQHDLALAAKDRELSKQRDHIGRLERDIAQRDRQIERLHTAMALLKVDRRVARLDVVRQAPNADGTLRTHVQFTELSRQGLVIGEPREFAIDGDLLYLDAWVIKFDDQRVEAGDPLRAASICLFRRAFGEHQQPSQGVPLDPAGGRPEVYGGGELSAWEQTLWGKFWDYANDPALARSEGVRAAHGEAPSMKLMPASRYKIELRASGGLSIVADGRAPSADGGAG